MEEYPEPLYEARNEPYSLRRGGGLSDVNARRIQFNSSQLEMAKEELKCVLSERYDLVQAYGYVQEVASRLGVLSNREIYLGNVIGDFKRANYSIRRFEIRRLNDIYTRVRSDPTNL